MGAMVDGRPAAVVRIRGGSPRRRGRRPALSARQASGVLRAMGPREGLRRDRCPPEIGRLPGQTGNRPPRGAIHPARGGLIAAHPRPASVARRRDAIPEEGDADPARPRRPVRGEAPRPDHVGPRVRRLVQDDWRLRPGVPRGLRPGCQGRCPDEGRKPTIVVHVTTKPRGLDFSLIGLVAGERVGEGLPYFRGFRGTEEDQKWLGAALASSGSCGMYHLDGVTPEARRAPTRGLPSMTITRRDLVAAKRSYTDGNEADVIALGSPQLSEHEVREIAHRVERTPPRIPVWVFTSRTVRDANLEAVGIIERHGGRVLADTCLEVTLLEHRFGTVATPSGKGAYYLPSLCKQKVILDDIERLLERYA